MVLTRSTPSSTSSLITATTKSRPSSDLRSEDIVVVGLRIVGLATAAAVGGTRLSEALPRNEAIGGYIFVCNNNTMQENLKRQLFGLPPRYRDSVRAITPGLPMFLYNYSTRQLHGIFQAASFGGTNIDPTAWEDRKSHGESRFPAQASPPPGLDEAIAISKGNSWLWDVDGVNILVDPILVGNLDFGIPWLYDAAKKVIKNFRLEDLPEIDCLLITQSLDDHCHLKTLKPLSEKVPDLRVIATPNAESKLKPLFRNVTYLEPSQSFEVEGENGAKVNIIATAGPVLGPPWQRPENGYIITCRRSQLTLYYEPHCVYNHSFLQKYQADAVITPVIKQLLPGFTLVSGQEDAVNLAKLLQAKYVIPMKNGDLDSKGILSSIINSEGTVESFKELLERELPGVSVLVPKPGEPIGISLSNVL